MFPNGGYPRRGAFGAVGLSIESWVICVMTSEKRTGNRRPAGPSRARRGRPASVLRKTSGDKAPSAAKPQTSIRILKGSELIANSIRRQIVLGELKENDLLPNEQELTAAMNVSRPTLREALRILEVEGLVQIRRGAHGGALIRHPQIETAAQSVGMLLQIRDVTAAAMLEAITVIQPPLVARLAREHTADDLRALRANIEMERKTIADFPAFAALGAEFHKLLVTRAGNVPLAVMAGLLDDVLGRHAARFIARERHDLIDVNKQTLRSHERVVERIAARDAAGAEKFWRDHLRAGTKTVLAELGSISILDLY
jgi:DNA-binding FadR family transcriptional regulator